MAEQLALAVQLRDTASFDSFWIGNNAQTVAALRTLRHSTLLYGPPQSGRTHLLQACCRAQRGAYLPLAELRDAGAEVLDGFAGMPLLCLDDVDAVADDRVWALALVRLLDQRRSDARLSLLSAAAPPEHLTLALPDLRTRLAACDLLGLLAPDDAQRAALLKDRAQARGLKLPDEVVRWLLQTQARSTGALLGALEALDRASLRAKRRLTLPFVQSVLSPASAAADAATLSRDR